MLCVVILFLALLLVEVRAAKDVNKWLDDIIGGYESSVKEF
jgi:hypothetical protein